MRIVDWKFAICIVLLHEVVYWKKFVYSILVECKAAVVAPLILQAWQWSSTFFVLTVKLLELSASQRLWQKTAWVTRFQCWKEAKDLMDMESELLSSPWRGSHRSEFRHISEVMWQNICWYSFFQGCLEDICQLGFTDGSRQTLA